MKPLLILVSGYPGTGKTTLAEKISERFRIPWFGKDEFKEISFDVLGSTDRAWSKKMGQLAFRIIYKNARKLLKTGSPVILEALFSPVGLVQDELAKVTSGLDVEILQVICACPAEIALERFKSRWISGGRHVGHREQENFQEVEEMLKKDFEPVPIEGKTIYYDSTNPSRMAEEDSKVFEAVTA